MLRSGRAESSFSSGYIPSARKNGPASTVRMNGANAGSRAAKKPGSYIRRDDAVSVVERQLPCANERRATSSDSSSC